MKNQYILSCANLSSLHLTKILISDVAVMGQKGTGSSTGFKNIKSKFPYSKIIYTFEFLVSFTPLSLANSKKCSHIYRKALTFCLTV